MVELIDIGKLVIERNIRSRRKLTVEMEEETEIVASDSCMFCSNPATHVLFFEKGSKRVCALHFLKQKNKRTVRGYRELQTAC